MLSAQQTAGCPSPWGRAQTVPRERRRDERVQATFSRRLPGVQSFRVSWRGREASAHPRTDPSAVTRTRVSKMRGRLTSGDPLTAPQGGTLRGAVCLTCGVCVFQTGRPSSTLQRTAW